MHQRGAAHRLVSSRFRSESSAPFGVESILKTGSAERRARAFRARERYSIVPAKRQTRSRVPHSGVTRRIALNERIGALQKEINRLRRSRDAVSRGEFREVVKSLHQIQDNTDALARHSVDLATQFTRFARASV